MDDTHVADDEEQEQGVFDRRSNSADHSKYVFCYEDVDDEHFGNLPWVRQGKYEWFFRNVKIDFEARLETIRDRRNATALAHISCEEQTLQLQDYRENKQGPSDIFCFFVEVE